MAKQINSVLKNAIIKEWEKTGKSSYKLADQFSISKSSAHYIIKKHRDNANGISANQYEKRIRHLMDFLNLKRIGKNK
ncbi:hypothetical protein [[Acholeplasma] multilocale]|uniref:hypothetical protein n=1 Tax=[Acholeplasma] multilocale TaxID=264638 RepID=UPI00047895CB|nr:hypothetical protein [[Acholeplasma] multilocale]